jgi:hypothetical protein
MSVDRPCECGATIPAYDLGCKVCGRKYKVRDEFLVGQEILPEPPVGMWAKQYEDNKSRNKHRFSIYKFVPRLKSKKAVWAALVVVLIGLYFVAEANPSLMPREINNGVRAIKREVVQVAPHSNAYQLGFDEGNKDRIKDEAGKALYDQLASYGYVDVPNIDEQIKLCGTPDTLWNEEDCSYLITTNSPEYKRKIYRQYAETLWQIVGLLNSLENTQKNKNDFIAGFLAGKSQNE